MVFDAKFNKIIIDESNTNVRLVVSKWLEDDLTYLASNIHTEFAFYLEKYEVKEYKGTTFFIIPHQEIIIPKQKASTAEVEILENLPYPINGHKHPEGVNTFSGTDLEYITNNADISLLVTKSGIQDATIRIIQNLKVLGDTMILIRMRNILRVFDEPKDFNLDEKVKEIKEKLQVPTPPTVQPYQYYDFYQRYYGLDDLDDITTSKKKSKKSSK